MLPLCVFLDTHPPISLPATPKSKEKEEGVAKLGNVPETVIRQELGAKALFRSHPIRLHWLIYHGQEVESSPRGTRWGNHSRSFSSNCLIKFRVKPAAGERPRMTQPWLWKFLVTKINWVSVSWSSQMTAAEGDPGNVKKRNAALLLAGNSVLPLRDELVPAVLPYCHEERRADGDPGSGQGGSPSNQ